MNYFPRRGVVTNYQGTITKSNTSYRYDVLNQMTGTTTSVGLEITYGYNGEGLRVLKTSNGNLYEGDKVILEVDGNGVEKARSVIGINQISRTIGGEVLYYMYNGHADVTQLTNTLGKTVATYYYDAFGEIIDSSGIADNPIRYAGYQYDEETGLYYLNARMYDPTIARFLQEDTYTGKINDPLSLNLYAYCNNNPLVYHDPTGHFGTTTGNGVPYEILHPGKSSTGTSTWNNGFPKEIQDKTNKSSSTSTSSEGTSTWNNGVPKEIQSKISKSNTSKSTTGTNSWNNGVPKVIQDKIDKSLKSANDIADTLYKSIIDEYYANDPMSQPVKKDIFDKMIDKLDLWIFGEQPHEITQRERLYSAEFMGIQMQQQELAYEFTQAFTSACKANASISRVNEVIDVEIEDINFSGNTSKTKGWTNTNTTRVGQWMSKSEFEQFVKTGEIPRTNVLTKGKEGYIKQANIGDYYTEFDIDSSLLKVKDENLGWSLVKSKNNMYLKLAEKKGITLPDPVGTNIEHIDTK